MDVRQKAAAALLVLSIAVEGADIPAISTDSNLTRVEELIAQMTLEEKAGQLTMLRAFGYANPGMVQDIDEALDRTQAGAVIGVTGAEFTRRLQRKAIEGSRLGVPLLFSGDVVRGFYTILPIPLAETASWDLDLVRRSARAAAIEATANGLHWTLAPVIDVTRDARWGRVAEGAGEDPFLGSAMAVARIRGFQGDSATQPSRMLTSAKHFVAYGAAEGGRDYNTADTSERTLHEVFLPPFRAAVEAGVDSIMAGFNEVSGIPMHANTALLKDLLRDKWHFNGTIVSDYNAVEELIEHGVAHSEASAAKLAMDATVDVEMVSESYASQLPTLVKNGQVSRQLLDDAVRRVLMNKARLGLFEDPYRYSDNAREKALTGSDAITALAREAAQKSIVLLKNDKELLPLSKQIRRIAIVGALAADTNSALGLPPDSNARNDAASIVAGIRKAVSKETRVVYAPGASPDSDDDSGIDDAYQAAMDSDIVIAVLGESSRMSGEAGSRAFLDLPGAQPALFERLLTTKKTLVVILMNGRPLAIPEIAEHVPAILETWFLGAETGNAVADVLFGDINPSGKLPVTFPRSVGQVPIYYNHKNTGRPPQADDLYTSKYVDHPWTPLYPFGHGLSYTTFSYGKPTLSAANITAEEALTVQVVLRNTGSRTGTEVVQLYLRDDVASVTRPQRSLRNFTRVTLAPGEHRIVSFLLDQEDFALLDRTYTRVVEAGTFTVFVGGSSTTENQASFEITSGARLFGPGSAIPRMLRKTASM